MNERTKHINPFTAADIQEYVQGKLPAEKMHAMEIAAMENPFLADAIEGMQNLFTNENTFINSSKELQKRLVERVKEKNKKSAFYINRLWLRVAASLILLFGLTALTYNLFIKKTSSKINIAISKPQAIVGDSVVQQKNIAPTAKSSEPIILPLNKKTKKKTTFNKEIIFDKKAVAREQSNNYSTAKFDSIHYNVFDSLKNFDTINKMADATVAVTGKVTGLEFSRKKSIQKSKFTGKVVDKNKNGIAGAVVKLKNKKNGTTTTTTNSDGYFHFEIDNKDSSANIIVTSVGYNSANATINNDDTATVSLQAAETTLNEVVVIGYGSTNNDENNNGNFYSDNKKKKENPQKATPVTGWENYNNYIDSNKKITTADSVKKGKEIISFLINDKGELSDFKIKKSLSPTHDDKAIRLVKNGPPWKLLKGKKIKVTFVIEF